MKYTEKDLTKFAVALGENVNERCLLAFKQALQKLCKEGYKQTSEVKRLDASASYYRVELENVDEEECLLELVGAYALNIVGPLDKEPEIQLGFAEDDEFQEYFEHIQKKYRATDYAFKKLARIMKHIQAQMVEAKLEAAEALESNEIITLIDILPVEAFKRFDSLGEKLRYALLQLQLKLEQAEELELEPEEIEKYKAFALAMAQFVELE